MRIAPVVSLALSIVLGAAAVFIGRGWLASDSDADSPTAAPAAIVSTTKVLVAKEDISSGEIVGALLVDTLDWPADLAPVGALSERSDLVRLYDGEAYANGFIAAGEPVLAAKLSVDPPRLTLSSGIEPGKRAVSIRVTDVTGVSGFVLPGDVVDINLLVTEGEAAGGRVRFDSLERSDTIHPVLSGARVLGVDQSFSQEIEGAAPSKTVTVEVTPDQGRALAVAGRQGQLFLALIGLDEVEAGITAPQPVVAAPRPSPVRRATSSKPEPARSTNIRIIHGGAEQSVSAPVAPKEAS